MEGKGGELMGEINIARQLVKARHEKKVTQEQLATYIGVSKAAVSKWESGASFPDITILPRLATYFNISIDDLLGYEPQLTKEDIKRTYHELKQRFANSSWEEAMEVCQELEKKYYSCFPFLSQLVVLYLNHAPLSANPKEVYEHCIELTRRIRTQGKDVQDAKEAASLEAMCYLLCAEPMKAMDLVGEENRPMQQDMELRAQIYQTMGKVEKAQESYQIAMYQYLLFFLCDSAAMFQLYAMDSQRVEDMIERTLQIMTVYDIDHLHPNTSANVYLSAAQIYCMEQRQEKCFAMLEKYVYICEHCFFPFILHGDGFFDKIDDWFQDFDLGEKAPRSDVLIRKSMVDAVAKNPAFEMLKEDKRYKRIIRELEKLV